MNYPTIVYFPKPAPDEYPSVLPPSRVPGTPPAQSRPWLVVDMRVASTFRATRRHCPQHALAREIASFTQYAYGVGVEIVIHAPRTP